MKIEVLSRKADYIGITGSVLCIVHCLITPVLLMTSALLQNEQVRFGYLSLDYLFIGINIVAVYFASRHAHLPIIKTALWIFLLLFATGIAFEDAHEAFEYVAYAASAGLVITHLINLRTHKSEPGFSRFRD